MIDSVSENEPKQQQQFDYASFKRKLAGVPQDELLKMAEDGTIDVGEVHRLFALMGLEKQEMELLQNHFHQIGQTVLRYVERTQHRDVKHGVCEISGKEAVDIMMGLLNRGLISRYYTKVMVPRMQQDLPNLVVQTQDQNKTLI